LFIAKQNYNAVSKAVAIVECSKVNIITKGWLGPTQVMFEHVVVLFGAIKGKTKMLSRHGRIKTLLLFDQL